MLNYFINKLNLSTNKKNVAKISMGTIIGQIISVITLPIVTRLYDANILGLWALMNSIILIINSFSDLGLSNSLMVQKDAEVEQSYRVISTVSFLFSTAAGIILSLFYVSIVDNIEFNKFFFMGYIMLASFTTQQTQICYTWLNRDSNYNLLMKNPIIHNIVYGILAIILGIIGFEKYGYFIAYVGAQFITLLNMKMALPKVLFTVKVTDFKKVFSENKSFLQYQTPTNMISVFQSQLPTFLIKTFWNTEMLGYYSITVKVLKVPITFLAKAIGRVFFQVTSKMKIEGKNIGNYVSNNLMKNMKIAVAPIILLMAIGDVIIVFFLGQDWKVAGEFIRLLSLQYYFMFIMGTVQGLSITLKKQHYAMITNIVQSIGYILGAIVGKFWFDDIYITLIIMSLFFIIVQIFYFCALLHTMNAPVWKYLINVISSISFIIVGSYFIRILLKMVFPSVFV